MDDNVQQFQAEIGVPRSTNNLYMDVSYRDKGTGKCRCRRVLTQEGRTYKDIAGYTIKAAANRAGWEYDGERLKMILRIYFENRIRRDITNCIKIAEDAAAEALGFDDTVVDSFLVERAGIDKVLPRADLVIIKIL
jgi:hypothetical protein